MTALGISRELAAFHLDRLVEVGLLQTEFRRRSGRTGPGAGRPAKFYRRADRDLEVALPPRDYDRAADLMAMALERLSDAARPRSSPRWPGSRGRASVRKVAHGRPAVERRRSLRGLIDVLGGPGYEPDVTTDGTVCLRNCPYKELAADHRDLTCGMNLAWAEGVVDGLGVRDVSAELDPEPGRCCVVFHAAG